MAYLFEIKPTTFEKKVTSMKEITSDFLYTRFAESYADKLDMQKRENAALEADRIIVDNVFSRQCTLCAVVANKHRCAEGGMIVSLE